MRHKLDKKLEDDWLEGKSDAPLPLNSIINMALHGIKLCSTKCDSMREADFDSCRCIRSIFPHSGHYDLYKQLREITENLLLLDEVITQEKKIASYKKTKKYS